MRHPSGSVGHRSPTSSGCLTAFRRRDTLVVRPEVPATQQGSKIMSTTAPAPVETADTPASEVMLPSPANRARCDANASGTEAAVARVYTPRGPIDLCASHLRRNIRLFDAFGYEVAYSDPDLHIDPYVMAD